VTDRFVHNHEHVFWVMGYLILAISIVVGLAGVYHNSRKIADEQRERIQQDVHRLNQLDNLIDANAHAARENYELAIANKRVAMQLKRYATCRIRYSPAYCVRYIR
jgi:hypothetical protein